MRSRECLVFLMMVAVSAFAFASPINEQDPVFSTQTGGTSQPPTPPLAPQSPADCSVLKKQWSDLMGQLQSEHEACLDAHRNQPQRPNSAAEVGKCSQAACSSLHDRLFNPEWKKYRQASEKWCDDRVRAYAEASERFRQQRVAAARQVAETKRKLEEANRATKERNARAIADLKGVIADMRRDKDETLLNTGAASAWALVEALGGAVETGTAGSKELSLAYGSAKNLTDALLMKSESAKLKFVGDALKEGAKAAESAEVAGELGTQGALLKSAGAAMDTYDKASKGDYSGAGISGAKTVAELAKASAGSATQGAGEILGQGATIASGVSNTFKGARHFFDALDEGIRLQDMSSRQIEQIDRRVDRLNDKTSFSESETNRRLYNLSEPIVRTIDNFGTTWGVRADRSVVDLNTGDVYYYDSDLRRVLRR